MLSLNKLCLFLLDRIKLGRNLVNDITSEKSVVFDEALTVIGILVQDTINKAKINCRTLNTIQSYLSYRLMSLDPRLWQSGIFGIYMHTAQPII